MHDLTVKVIRISENAILPVRATEFSAGYDIFSAEKITILSGKVEKIRTGIALEIPPGYEGQIRPRSGLSTRNTLLIPNSPGTIDADFRGEIEIALYNANKKLIEISEGMRIAQLLIKPILTVNFEEVQGLSKTKRGNGGFGSTGK